MSWIHISGRHFIIAYFVESNKLRMNWPCWSVMALLGLAAVLFACRVWDIRRESRGRSRCDGLFILHLFLLNGKSQWLVCSLTSLAWQPHSLWNHFGMNTLYLKYALILIVGSCCILSFSSRASGWPSLILHLTSLISDSNYYNCCWQEVPL